MKNKILVVGSANTDIVIHSPKLPALGETLVGHNFQINAGGKGLNQAVAIAKLGGDVTFLGSLGEDENGQTLLRVLKENGVAFQGILGKDHPTGVAMITVVDGNNFILLNAGANEKLSPEIISEHTELIQSSDFCVMQLEIPPETVEMVCDIARAGNTKIVLNPAPYKALPKSILASVDYLIPNEHEAFDLTGIYPDNEENCRKAIERLKEMGAKNVIITLGEHGCVYSAGSDITFCPARKVTAVDTTSAGDCFIGAFVAKLSKGNTVEDAIAFATKAAAIAVTREGASRSIPFAHEVE